MFCASRTKLYSFDGTSRILLSACEITALSARSGLLAAALANGEIVLFSAGTQRRLTSGLDGAIDCLLMINDDPVDLLIGSADAQLFRLRDDGLCAMRNEQFAELPCRLDWYTPWGGPPAVRSMTAMNDCVYADVHVGSIMRSVDRGASWEPVEPQLHEDVHQVVTCLSAPSRVYANTADAVWVSEDRGVRWEQRAEGMSARYGRAVAVHPQDPDCLLASVSNGPHGDAQGLLYRTEDAGRHWTHVENGFPAAILGNIDTFQLIYDDVGVGWVAAGKFLYKSGDRGARWEKVWQADAGIQLLCSS